MKVLFLYSFWRGREAEEAILLTNVIVWSWLINGYSAIILNRNINDDKLSNVTIQWLILKYKLFW
jgi:hypothetical protein